MLPRKRIAREHLARDGLVAWMTRAHVREIRVVVWDADNATYHARDAR